MTALDLWLVVAGASALAYEIVYSDAAEAVKRILGIDTETAGYQKLLKLKYDYRSFWLSVFFVAVKTAGTIQRFFYKLLSCPYCTGFQLGFWLALLHLRVDVVQSILIAGATCFATALYNLIRTKSI